MNKLMERISNIGIVPVVSIQQLDDALPLANALYKSGIDVVEITFRSEHAKDAIAIIHKELPDMLIGAGTVLTIQQAQDALQAGASFIITPGFNEVVVTWCLTNNVLILPGVASASEIELALAHGIQDVKFFPAESSGGAKKLKDLGAPYPQVHFLPTGGIHEGNMHEYLSLPNVLAIGGSFMFEKEAIDKRDWQQIQTCCEHALTTLLSYELLHIGIHHKDCEEAEKTALLLCRLFRFQHYQKPKSQFAGRGFEILPKSGEYEHGHIGIYTPYPQRAMYQLQKLGISFKEESITRNKKTKAINFVYLDFELAGFGIHLINPDVKM